MDNIAAANCTSVQDCDEKCCQEKEAHSHSASNFIGRFVTFCALHLFGFDRHNIKCPKRKRQQEISRDAWLHSFGLLRSEDMPTDLQELYLVVGYRPNPSSLSYCLKSIFYPTNETMNFWTHFVSLLIIINRFYVIFSEKIFGEPTDPMYYPLWVYSAGCCLMLLGSCVAHVLSCLSRNARESCWFCDYASITLSTLGSTIVYHFYVCPYECMGISIKYYIQLMGVSGVVGHALCCYSRRMTSKVRYAIRSLVFALLYLISFVPCSYLCITHSGKEFNAEHSLNSTDIVDLRCHIGMTSFRPAMFLVSFFSLGTVVFNVTKFPEKYFPGTFDIVGHSHQWLHVTIALAFYFQISLIEDSMLDMNKLMEAGMVTAEDFHIGWWNSIGTMTTVGLLCLMTCGYFTSILPATEKQKTS